MILKGSKEVVLVMLLFIMTVQFPKVVKFDPSIFGLILVEFTVNGIPSVTLVPGSNNDKL